MCGYRGRLVRTKRALIHTGSPKGFVPLPCLAWAFRVGYMAITRVQMGMSGFWLAISARRCAVLGLRHSHISLHGNPFHYHPSFRIGMQNPNAAGALTTGKTRSPQGEGLIHESPGFTPNLGC